jgi:hypothetical protein
MVVVLARLIALVRLVMGVMDETLELLSAKLGLQIHRHPLEQPFLLRHMVKAAEMEVMAPMLVALRWVVMAATVGLVVLLQLISIQLAKMGLSVLPAQEYMLNRLVVMAVTAVKVHL